MAALVFDIETIGDDFDGYDPTSQEVLTRWIKQTSKSDEEYEASLKDLKNGLGFSPLTGQIVAVGVYDSDKDKGAVYYQAPGSSLNNSEEGDIKYVVSSEAEILRKFWELAIKYDTFVTFNGRAFDVPFIMIRSGVHRIKPTKNLLANRYANYQKYDATHIDLMDQLTFYGASRFKGSNLHMFTRAFGIESPKASGVKGDDVTELFKEGKFLDIARYNALDIIATNKLYKHWVEYIKM